MAHGFHFYEGAPPLYRWLYYNMERLASRWTAGLIVLNREDLLAAKRFGLIEGENLFLAHGVGVDLDCYRPDPPTGEGQSDDGSWRYAGGCPGGYLRGRVYSQQEPHPAVAAWKRWSAEMPAARLLLVGNGETWKRR